MERKEQQTNTEKRKQRTAEKGKRRMAAEVSSIARMLRGEAGKRRAGAAGKAPEMVTMDLLGGCGGDAGGQDEVVDLEVKVPAGWERRLDLLRSRSPPSSTASPPANPAMRASACPSCLTYVLIAEADPRCPRCASKVPPLPTKPAAHSSGKKPKIDLNAAADETE
ncbi:hypothetical protein TRIUR3_21502 [Triticum urartu]|uniref:GIR1-like zinc ribbon domain-containing protein n=1 Tax=Triticum urartu TaxID=4572 RepID=M7ZUX9_TRIUA|nr:hypothetical protein TRIUR3_21502 [Triticum urartu]